MHQDWNPAGHLHVLDAPAQFAARLGQRLAVFGADDARDVFEILVEQLLQAEQILDAVRRRHGAPLRKCGGGGLHGGANIFSSAGGRVPDYLAGSRIEHLAATGGGRPVPFTGGIISYFVDSNHPAYLVVAAIS